jgi:MFS family permease
MSFVISSLAELPSYLFTAWAIGRLGRHNTMAGCMVLGGAACTACAFAPAGASRVALASVGKFGVSGAFAIASVLTGELHPTLIRSAVLGVMNQAARAGAISAPFVVMAGARAAGGAGGAALVPFLTFGAASLLAACLIFTLPETNGTPLPDTMDDMRAIASIFTHRTLARQGLRAAAASMFKARVRLPGGERGRGGRGAGCKGGGAAPAQQSIWGEDEARGAVGGSGGAACGSEGGPCPLRPAAADAPVPGA